MELYGTLRHMKELLDEELTNGSRTSNNSQVLCEIFFLFCLLLLRYERQCSERKKSGPAVEPSSHLRQLLPLLRLRLQHLMELQYR